MMRVNRRLAGFIHVQFRTLPTGRSTVIHHLSTQGTLIPKKKSRIGLYTVSAVILASGGALVYAKYNDNFRKEIADNVPYANEIIKTVFQEERSYSDSISVMLGVGPDAATDQRAPASTPSKLEKKIEKTEKPVQQSSSEFFRPVLSVDDLKEIEKAIAETAAQLATSYRSIGKILEEHIVIISEAIDKCSDRLNPSLAPIINEQTKELSKRLAEEEAKVKKGLERLNEFRVRVRDGRLEGARDLIDVSRRRIEQSAAAVKDSAALINENRNLKLLADQTWQKLEKTRTAFVDELHTLFPSLDMPTRSLDLDAPEINLFLLYSYLQVQMYENRLSKLEANRALKIKRALSSLNSSEEDQEKISNMVSEEVIALRNVMEADMKKKVHQLKQECEAQITQQLARASQAHLLNVADLELQQEAMLVQKHAAVLDECLKATRSRNEKALSEMKEQLKDVETLVKSRSDADYSAQRAQMLWSACHSIVRSLRRLQPLKTYEKKIVSVKEEMEAISSSSMENDVLVAAVIQGIPEEAIKRGVFTEEALCERFKKVEKVSKGLALLPEQGGRLSLYLLSWIQSYLLSNIRDYTHSSVKLERPVSSDISTLEALSEARYWIDRGDLLQALRFMNLLKGYSRHVAADWIRETRIHLETIQAAEALMAHAVSLAIT